MADRTIYLIGLVALVIFYMYYYDRENYRELYTNRPRFRQKGGVEPPVGSDGDENENGDGDGNEDSPEKCPVIDEWYVGKCERDDNGCYRIETQKFHPDLTDTSLCEAGIRRIECPEDDCPDESLPVIIIVIIAVFICLCLSIVSVFSLIRLEKWNNKRNSQNQQFHRDLQADEIQSLSAQGQYQPSSRRKPPTLMSMQRANVNEAAARGGIFSKYG